MNVLSKEETVWLQAYCAHAGDPELQVKQLTIYADAVLACFQDRFPPSPPPQNEAVSGLAQEGVYITREMLAKAAANLRPNWSQTDRLLMVEQFSKELGLKP